MKSALYLLFLVAVCSVLSVCTSKDSEDASQTSAEDKAVVADKQADVLPGRWREHNFRDKHASLTADQKEAIQKLEAIGYVGGSVEAPSFQGVVILDSARAWHGYNLYVSGHSPQAVLMDMQGRILHRWQYPFEAAFPQHRDREKKPDMDFWRKVYLFDNGDILAVHEGLGILKLDKSSRLMWAKPHPAHHDLQVMANGDIFVLTRVAHMVPSVSERYPILEDFISILDADGNEKSRSSILDIFDNSPDEHSWLRAWEIFWAKESNIQLAYNPKDLFHTNSVEVLDGKIADRAPAFRKGNILLSMCHLDMIAVVDSARQQVVWSLSEAFSLQHDPTITSDGHIMLFDNVWRQGKSRVIVLDPASREIVWQYNGSDEQPFYSQTCGTAKRLPNGNTLITESDNGRAFEVTMEGEIVWEFYNPHRAGDKNQYIATLFEMMRLAPDFPMAWTAE
jgi:hypothetical protein